MVQQHRRGQEGRRGAGAHRPHLPGGQPVRQLPGLPEGQRTDRGRRHRQAEHGGGLARPQHRHRRLAILHSARCVPRQRRLGPLPRAARPSVRSSPSGCSAGAITRITAPAWRAICSSTCSPACTSPPGRMGPERVMRHRRPALLERRARRAGRDAGHARLPGAAGAPRVHPGAAGEFQERRAAGASSASASSAAKAS